MSEAVEQALTVAVLQQLHTDNTERLDRTNDRLDGVEAQLKEILEVINLAKGGWRLLLLLGKFAAGASAIAYSAWRFFFKHQP